MVMIANGPENKLEIKKFGIVFDFKSLSSVKLLLEVTCSSNTQL